MKTNFRLYQNYAINQDQNHYDLHNNFEFLGFDVKIDKRMLRLFWKSRSAEWVPVGNPLKLIIHISELSFLMALPRDQEMPYSEDDCLMDFTYYPITDREENDCITDQEIPDENDDIIFKFQSGQTIRARGNQITVEIVKEGN